LILITFTNDKNNLEDPNVRIWKKAKLTLANLKQVKFRIFLSTNKFNSIHFHNQVCFHQVFSVGLIPLSVILERKICQRFGLASNIKELVVA